VYDGWRVIQERDGDNVPTVSYTRGTDLSGSLEGAGGIGGLLARSHDYSSGTWSTHNYYQADGNGNITALVDSSGTLQASYRYDPYGNTLSSSGSLAGANTYRFSSKEWLATAGLYYYYGYRCYSPNWQRWVNRDPIHEVGFASITMKRGFYSRLEQNLFAFVNNRPISFVDTLGLVNWGPLGGTCCNRSSGTEWALVGQPGSWMQLGPGQCTGSWTDCDGMTCGGGFYFINNGEQGTCATPGNDSPQCANRRWTPNNPAPGSQPPGEPARPGRPGGEHRGSGSGHEPPPNYPWSER
jgi:RHS repeat-associated protein